MSFDLTEIERRATELRIAEDYKIGSAIEAQDANATLITIKELARAVEKAKREELDPIAESEKAIRSKFRPAELLLVRAEAVVKRELLAFQNVERRRLAQENAAREAAAAKEQARLRAEAEEVRRKAEAKAAELEAAGKPERAAATLAVASAKAAAVDAVASLVPATVATVKKTPLAGFTTSTRWVGEIADARLFLIWLASNENMDPTEVVEFKKAGLNRLAALFKKGAPGFVSRPEEVARSA